MMRCNLGDQVYSCKALKLEKENIIILDEFSPSTILPISQLKHTTKIHAVSH